MYSVTNFTIHGLYNNGVRLLKLKTKGSHLIADPTKQNRAIWSRFYGVENFRVGFTKYIEHLCYSEQEYRVEHFKYIMCLLLCRTFYSISSSLYKKKTCSTPIRLNRVKQFCYLSRLYRVEHFCFSECFRYLNINLRVKNF